MGEGVVTGEPVPNTNQPMPQQKLLDNGAESCPSGHVTVEVSTKDDKVSVGGIDPTHQLLHLVFPVVSVGVSIAHCTGVRHKQVNNKGWVGGDPGSASSLPGPVLAISFGDVSMVGILQKLLLQ